MLITRRNLPKLINTVLFLAGDGNYSIIHLKDRQKAILATTLCQFEKDIPALVRIHKAYLLNPLHIASCNYKQANIFCLLTDGTKLPVSRRRVKEVKYRLNEPLVLL